MKRLLLALCLAGVALPCRAEGDQAKGSAGGPIVIGMSAPWMEYGTYHWIMRQQAEKTAAALGVKVVFADAVWSAPKQVADLKRFVAQGVKGILLAPMSGDLGPTAELATKAGIPVITLGVRLTPDVALAHVGSDDAAAGRMAAQLMLEKLGNKGTIVELVAPIGIAPPVDERRAAFEAVVKGSQVELVTARMNGLGRWEGQQALAHEFISEPGFAFDGLLGANDGSVLGALECMPSFGVDPARKVVVSFDGIPEAYQYLREGQLTATVAGYPDKMVDQALRQLVNYIRTGKAPSQKTTLVKPELVTKGATPAG